MNRNKEPIRSEDQVLNAARTVYRIAKLLKLTRRQFLDMYELDVIQKIEYLGTADGALIKAHARGVRDVYLTIILTEHCEFVYRKDGFSWSVKEVMQEGPGQRSGATCGHKWLDSDFDFTEFVEEIDPWI